MYMNTWYCTLKFKDKQLLMRTMQQYYHNNNIKSSTSKNYKLTALSLAHLTKYGTGNKYGYKKQIIYKSAFTSLDDANN